MWDHELWNSLPEFETWLNHCMCLWGSHLTTLSFSFLFCKTGIINLHHTNLVRIKWDNMSETLSIAYKVNAPHLLVPIIEILVHSKSIYCVNLNYGRCSGTSGLYFKSFCTQFDWKVGVLKECQCLGLQMYSWGSVDWGGG